MDENLISIFLRFLLKLSKPKYNLNNILEEFEVHGKTSSIEIVTSIEIVFSHSLLVIYLVSVHIPAGSQSPEVREASLFFPWTSNSSRMLFKLYLGCSLIVLNFSFRLTLIFDNNTSQSVPHSALCPVFWKENRAFAFTASNYIVYLISILAIW